METLLAVFRHHPEIALFLTLAIGFWFGALKFGKFSLGAVTSTLIAGLIVGQLGITMPEMVQTIFFLLFLFAVGYSVGPQFFGALKKDGLPQVGFALIVCAVGFATAWVAAKVMGYGPGLAAGLLAGAYTNSGTLGVASANIGQIGLGGKEATAAAGLAAISYAVTYPFGAAGAAWFLSSVAPKILGVDLPKATKELEAQMASHGGGGGTQAYRPIASRAYLLANAALAGRTPRDLAAALQGAVVTRFRQGTQIVDADAQAVIPQGATLALSGSPHALFAAKETVGPEVEDKELLAYPTEEIDVVVTNKKAVGRTVQELEQHELEQYGRRLFLVRVTRAGAPLTVTPEFKIESHDVLAIHGDRKHVDDLAKALGKADRPTSTMDVSFMSLGIVIGCLVGLLTLHVGAIPLSLSTSVGTLIAGLVCGYLRSKYRTFGGIPGPAVWALNNIGLNGFIAVVGLNAAAGLVEGLKAYGVGLFASGILVSLVPLIVGVYAGKYLFKFHPTMLLGACAGARSTTAGLGAVQEAAQSSLPAVGYTIPYAVSRIVLALFGIAILLATK